MSSWFDTIKEVCKAVKDGVGQALEEVVDNAEEVKDRIKRDVELDEFINRFRD